MESGPTTISARYSAGYVYYLDQNYLAADHNGGIFSQSAGLDISFEGDPDQPALQRQRHLRGR